MSRILLRHAVPLMAAACLLIAGAILVSRVTASGGTEAKITEAASEALPNLPGQRITVLEVAYEPGGKSAGHKHAGAVLAYVVEGEIRSGLNGEEPTVYKAGESFFEPPGTTHTVSENASATKPAKLIAIFVAPAEAKLTVPAE